MEVSTPLGLWSHGLRVAARHRSEPHYATCAYRTGDPESLALFRDFVGSAKTCPGRCAYAVPSSPVERTNQTKRLYIHRRSGVAISTLIREHESAMADRTATATVARTPRRNQSTRAYKPRSAETRSGRERLPHTVLSAQAGTLSPQATVSGAR